MQPFISTPPHSAADAQTRLSLRGREAAQPLNNEAIPNPPQPASKQAFASQ
jgi:hypothetical protein